MDVKTGDKVQFTGYQDTSNVEVAALPGIVTVVTSKPTAEGETVIVVKDETGAYLNTYKDELRPLEDLQDCSFTSNDLLPAEVERFLIDKFTIQKFEQMLANNEVGDYLKRLAKANKITSTMAGGIFHYLTVKDAQGNSTYKTLVPGQTFSTIEEFVSEYLVKTLGFSKSTLWSNKAVFEACLKANLSSEDIEGIQTTNLIAGLPLLGTITPESSELIKKEVLDTLKNNKVKRIQEKAQELKNKGSHPKSFEESKTVTLPTEGFATLKLVMPRQDYIEIIDSILPEARLVFDLDDTISDAYVITRIAKQWQMHNSLQGDISAEHVIYTLEKVYGIRVQQMGD